MIKKNVVITGCAGGLAKELLKLWAGANNYNLCLLSRKDDPEVVELSKSYGLSAQNIAVDLLDETKINELATTLEQEVGAIWGVVNLAGVGNNGLSWKMGSCSFREVIDGNLLTTFHVIRAFLPGMRAAGQGRIINASSVVASTAVFGASAYIAAKSGIEGLTRAIALENAAKSITANSVALGYFNSGMINTVPDQVKSGIIEHTPLKRLGTGQDLAGIVDFLLSDSSGFITGQTIAVNGGLHFR